MMDCPPVIHDHVVATARQHDHNVRAEERGAEEAHQARWDAARRCFLVSSEGGGRTYQLTCGFVTVLGRRFLTVSCTCPSGVHRRPPAGVMVCKHATRVARRLERLGFAEFGADGRWRVTRRLVDLAAALENEGP